MNLSPIIISVKTAILSTLISLIIALYIANKVKHLNILRSIFDVVFTLPMVLPPTVVGFFLLVVMGVNGPLASLYEKFNFQIIFSYKAMVIAAVIVSFPLMYKSVLSSFLQIDENIVYAARTLGLSDREIFFKIIIPLSKEGILSGIILTFTRALGEFGATIMVSGNILGKTQSISTAIYSAVQSGNKGIAYKWSLIVVIISMACIVSLNFITSKGKSYGTKS